MHKFSIKFTLLDSRKNEKYHINWDRGSCRTWTILFITPYFFSKGKKIKKKK